jgi:hypothetical protein
VIWDYTNWTKWRRVVLADPVARCGHPGSCGEENHISKHDRVELVRQTGGATKIFIDAVIGEGGDLVMEGQDVGAAPMQMFDDEDYEYWVTVRAEHKDRVLLGLMQQVFSDPSASSRFMEWLKKRGIPFEFSSY